MLVFTHTANKKTCIECLNTDSNIRSNFLKIEKPRFYIANLNNKTSLSELIWIAHQNYKLLRNWNGEFYSHWAPNWTKIFEFTASEWLTKNFFENRFSNFSPWLNWRKTAVNKVATDRQFVLFSFGNVLVLASGWKTFLFLLAKIFTALLLFFQWNVMKRIRRYLEWYVNHSPVIALISPQNKNHQFWCYSVFVLAHSG